MYSKVRFQKINYLAMSSFIKIIPKEGLIRVKVPVPNIFASKEQSSSNFGIILEGTPKITILESERIAQVNSFYSGLRVSYGKNNEQTRRNINFCVPKIAQVVSSSVQEYKEDDYVVLTHWNAMSDMVLDESKEYMYLLIDKTFISGKLENKEDGERIFDIYRTGDVEDTPENMKIRLEEEKAIMEQTQADAIAKAEHLKKMPNLIIK